MEVSIRSLPLCLQVIVDSNFDSYQAFNDLQLYNGVGYRTQEDALFTSRLMCSIVFGGHSSLLAIRKCCICAKYCLKDYTFSTVFQQSICDNCCCLPLPDNPYKYDLRHSREIEATPAKIVGMHNALEHSLQCEAPDCRRECCSAFKKVRAHTHGSPPLVTQANAFGGCVDCAAKAGIDILHAWFCSGAPGCFLGKDCPPLKNRLM